MFLSSPHLLLFHPLLPPQSSLFSSSFLLLFVSLILGCFFITPGRAQQLRLEDILSRMGGMEMTQKMAREMGEGQQSDPLRRVFSIWGRLLNRMAQQNPPSDDELHLKGAQESTEEGGNLISEDPEGGPGAVFPPRGGAFGGGTGRSLGFGGGRRPPSEVVGPDRIIDQQRLEAILPRINPNGKGKKAKEPTTTTMGGTTPTTEGTAETPTTSSSSTTTRRSGRKKKAKRKKNSGAKADGGTMVTEARTNGANDTTETTATTPISTIGSTDKPSKIPPMSILKGNETEEEGEEEQKQQMVAQQTMGTTLRLRTTTSSEREEDGGGGDQVGKLGMGTLNETVLARMENETAQLIAEIENVLADAEMGPNAGGHWLKQKPKQEETNGTTTTTTMETETTMAGRKEEQNVEKVEEKKRSEEAEEGESEEDEEESSEEEEVEDPGKSQPNTTSTEQQTTRNPVTTMVESPNSTETMMKSPNNTVTMKTTEETKKANETRKWIPEAEEEDQQQVADIAQLQLDSGATVTVPTTTAQTPQSAQNIFNLNANSNSYANPNFSNVMKPVNSIIDGIGPLILPLVGYSQRAFGAYAPYAAQQRVAGVPIFRPPGESPQLASPVPPQQPPLPQHPIPLTHQPSLAPPATSLQRPTSVPVPLPLQSQSDKLTRQIPSGETPANDPNRQQQTIPDPPSLELLGRIIEQRRRKERRDGRREEADELLRQRSRSNVQEVSGSSPPQAEQAYFPPALSRLPPQPVPIRPPTTEQLQSDRGYDAGRRTVQSTFHEDSGIMVGGQSHQAPTAHGLPHGASGQGGFGSGRRPDDSPSLL